MQIRKQITYALILFLASASLFCVRCSAEEYRNSSISEIQETARYVLAQTPYLSISSSGGEWALIGIKRSGIDIQDSYFDDYLKNARAIIDLGADLGRKYTEYSRLVLALSTLNIDAEDFGNSHTNLFKFINDYDNVTKQGINGPIFALEAKKLGSDSDTEICSKYISYIISRQNSDGSFGLSESAADTDITAMAISSLCLYINDYPNLKKVINKAFLYLSSVQHDDGGFSENTNEPESNCDSTAQVIAAIKRFGLKGDDRFFTKNGSTPYDALCKFRCADGGYKHKIGDTKNNIMSTEQALLALTESRGSNKTLMYDTIWFNANIKYLENIK